MKYIQRATISVLLVLCIAATVFAQRPGQGLGPPPGVFEKIQIMRMLWQIDGINKNPKFALKPNQARKTLAIIKPLRAKKILTQAQARKALKDLRAIFTPAQLKAMDARPRMGMRPGGPDAPPPKGQRPGAGMRPPKSGTMRPGAPPPGKMMPPPGMGQGRPAGAPPKLTPNFNPLYKNPKAKGIEATHNKQTDSLLARLEKIAKSARPAAKGKK